MLVTKAVIFGLLAVGPQLLRCQSAAQKQRYQDISSEIFYPAAERNGKAIAEYPPPAKVEAAVAELHDLVQAVVLQALAVSGASSQSVERAVTDLQAETWWEPLSKQTKVPFADLSEVVGTPILAVAFPILAGGGGIPDSRVYIQFYSRLGGVWKLQAETGSEFKGSSFSMASIHSALKNEAWYLFWAKRIGYTGHDGKLRLYGFDGWSLRTVWQRDGERIGDVSIAGDQVKFDYYEYAPWGVLIPPKHVTETLHVTPNGLQP